MSIIKITKRENPFAMIDKTCLEDPTLSFKAKGILAYLLSKPHDWRVRLEDIVKHSNEGIDSIRSGMKELVEAGYAVLRTEHGPKGHVLGKYYEVYEAPTRTDIGKMPMSVKPPHRHRQNTDVGKTPTTVKSDPTNIEIITNKESTMPPTEKETLADSHPYQIVHIGFDDLPAFVKENYPDLVKRLKEKFGVVGFFNALDAFADRTYEREPWKSKTDFRMHLTDFVRVHLQKNPEASKPIAAKPIAAEPDYFSMKRPEYRN